MGIDHYTINEKVSKTRVMTCEYHDTPPEIRFTDILTVLNYHYSGIARKYKQLKVKFDRRKTLLYNPVFDSLRKKKWLYP